MKTCGKKRNVSSDNGSSQRSRLEGEMVETVVTGFVGGIFAWFFTNYITQPVQRFFDLRREVNRCLVVYGNVGARSAIAPSGQRVPLHNSTEEDARLVEGQNAFRDLAGKMRAFANVDRIANRIVTCCGYDADNVATALIGYSNEIMTDGPGRAAFSNRIEKLLKISSVTRN
jgi:hypothetical protein